MDEISALVLADTHLTGATFDRLLAVVLDAAARADLILHAGDVVTAEVLERLEALAPVHAVLGNNDEDRLASRLGPTLTLRLAGVEVAMVHDSGPTAGRPGRMRRRFPTADIVVFGHSHAPVDEAGDGAQLLFNPGSPTQRRRQPERTYGWLRLRDGSIVDRSIIAIPND